MFLETKREGEQIATRQEPSLAGFIAWLETKDPSEKYNWACSANCACTQYFRAAGSSYACSIAGGLDMLAYQKPWNFGALLRRAKAAAL